MYMIVPAHMMIVVHFLLSNGDGLVRVMKSNSGGTAIEIE